ncbi:MAG: multi-sensor signal transduction histidine kinase [Candidatus Peregrinibacteria bacterium GW2011_GWF2_33_10]|nr:MAG: multi-sensor signal transduction histidine kinase [Candidatus Peregrinibacteria bacterium GW2011_GWF2_33_10]OGJ44433.1 MAG: hypothetical protein A2263_01990 [Candidatus Peregrinibacteria bacterium RIFOXYA2_FULL_33_21]OGJ46726.1 MAG: hypothetical protein A2272_03285 [Candidatus Peregrinibacteria bacterium RIFOXYA12_FULL_33_12]OGJ50132.1 MAG: hypothetical protein A2307_04315 [Candidatus Peregrinibacteria bacterium RIFOXYB2_FULL_33_20]
MEKFTIRPIFIPQRNKLILGGILLCIAGVLVSFYAMTNKNLTKFLRENMVSIAELGALSVDGDLIEKIQTVDDMSGDNFRIISNELNKVKDGHPSIKYVYTMRKTDTPDVVTFIVDADNYLTVNNPDKNNNGVIDPEEELPQTGELYNSSHAPQLMLGFDHPTADYKINSDQWGTWLSGYAPIKNSQGEVVALLGIDMSAANVEEVLNRAERASGFLIVLVLAVAASMYSIITVKQKELLLSEEANNIKGSFLTKISHELRTPIVAITGFVDLIFETNKGLEADTKSHLESINLYAQRLIRKVNHIIDFAKIKAAKISVIKSQFYIEELINDVKNSLHPLIKENHIIFKIDIQEAKEKIYLDKEKVFDILSNLIANAIKFTSSGGIIQVSAKIKQQILTLEVSDTGIGIPKQHLDNIFNDFTQLETNESLRKYKGSGLGLFIVKGLVELLQGEISVKSIVNKGTTFTIKLPV